MKSILQSIKPQYCELIASGKKTIEVRKTRPKLDVPFKVYIYCTKDGDPNGYQIFAKTSDGIKGICTGKVIGEYVCDRIEAFSPSRAPYETDSTITKTSCLSIVELIKYSNMDKLLYAWHISDLKIYDKPKEMSEFGKECNLDCPSVHCPYWKYQRVNADEWDYDCTCNNIRPLTHPPQSWCYVEEV